jgi:protein-S-isoprenylcysteine O-methyltransferase Ste14
MALLFAIVCACLLWLTGCTLWSIFRPERRTHPPIRREGIVFRVNAVLGPGINFGLLALAVLGWNSFAFDHWLRYPLGAALFAAGGYLGLGGFLRLGVERSLGHAGELVDSGPYRFSRNPQYVGALLAFAGLNLICNSALGLLATLLAGVWWLSLPFAEEPWLREKLGARYDGYAARVPRFLGVRRPRAIGR